MLRTGEKRQHALEQMAGIGVEHSVTVAASADAEGAQKRSKLGCFAPENDGTGTRKSVAAQVKHRWAKLHRVSKVRYGKRRADLPLVCNAMLRGKGLDGPHLDTKAIDELRGAFAQRQLESQRKRGSRGGWPGLRSAA